MSIEPEEAGVSRMKLSVAVVMAACLVAAGTACSSGSSAKASSSGAKGTGSLAARDSGADTQASNTTKPVTRPSNTVWLCRPGLADNPCDTPRAATAVAADGTQSPVKDNPVADPKIDCFYVYPTVSFQKGPNADLTIDKEETEVAVAQASRFSDVCRVYAPMYRQLTLSAIGGGATAQNRELAYGDVQSAWLDYLARDNKGRGVVLIGHSQGAGMLDALVKAQVDKKPEVRKKLVSALLLGGNVVVPKGKDVGGDFDNVPACRANDQTGCVVAYSTFDNPPPDNTLFGKPRRSGTPSGADSEVLCTNPAALKGGSAALHPYFPTHENLDLAKGALSDTGVTNIATPWVTFPGLWTAQCQSQNGANWLQVTDTRQPGDTRPKLVNNLGASWGLHLLDINLPYGDLVDLVRAQAKAYAGAH